MRLLRRALRGLVGHARLHLLTLATVALTFLVVATLALIHFNLNRGIAAWQSQFRMVVVLRPALHSERVFYLQRELESLPGVAGAEFVDSAAALEALEERLSRAGEGPGRGRVLELLTDNPLPSSFRLRVRQESLSPSALKALAGRAEALEGVAEVRYGDAWVSRFYSFFRLFNLVAAATSGLLFVTAAFIISSQIRLVLALRRNELDVLRLLGASGVYIGGPYLLEGVLVGAGGAALALALLLALSRLFVARAGTEVESLLTGVCFLPPSAILALIGFGAAVGLLGSLVSVRRLS
jgi:cell division transport system permease protein